MNRLFSICPKTGVEDEVDKAGNVELTELGGKAVTSVVGTTPLEAWGQALLKLGLLDEIMYEDGMRTVADTRKNALQEAKEKLELGKPGGSSKPGRKSSETEEKARRGSISTAASADEESKKNEDDQAEVEESGRDPPSEKEKHLRRMVEELTEELEEAMSEDAEATAALADARIAALGGPMMCNPFPKDSKAQQSTWMSLAVRKEKARMGSTGNKRKIVGAVDLLERNNTFYNPDIEALIEGLPGTEYCNRYVFQAQRSGGGTAAANRQWIHEAQLKHEKEVKRRSKIAKEVEAKENQQRERNMKRKQIQDARDEKKRQKMEEEEEKRKARIEERLSRLRIQVDERLFKEASFQREKVVAALARNLSKEYQRRRRAAEIVAGQFVIEHKGKRAGTVDDDWLSCLISDKTRVYNEEAVRVWDFISTFGSFFVERGHMTEVPTLDSLQNAVDGLRGSSLSKDSIPQYEAFGTMKDLAMSLCKPLAISLTRVLFASLIALNPILQKEFGAAFFNDMSSGTTEDKEGFAEKADVVLPVNDMTWLEIARQSFVADALGELGLQRHEVAHLLRGYRSAGHPNSKEALRLRKAEGFSTFLVQQELTREKGGFGPDHGQKTRIQTPCTPAFNSKDYRFYLHVAHSLEDDLEVIELRENLTKAVEVFKEDGLEDGEGKTSVVASVDEILTLLKEVQHPDQPTKPETKVIKKARRLLRNLVNKVAVAPVPVSTGDGKWPWKKTNKGSISSRERVGLVSTLSLSKEEYKQFTLQREAYMEEALRMKEENEGEQGNEDDDDDDDDDMEQNAEVVTNGEEGNAPSASEGENGDEKAVAVRKVGKETPYDEYCADIPEAPELIRRCLAVLRTLALTSAAEPFHYPVDPQLFPNYYDSVLRPMCLNEAGKRLQKVAKVAQEMTDTTELVEKAVLEFGRNIRLIGQNCIIYANAGPMVIAAGTELVRVFERLFLDWVLAPKQMLPPLEHLDDERCVDSHPSDDSSTVLLCDGCEGKYNISRLKPPLKEIPKGDWYCPRCISGRWWGDLDPRIGKSVLIPGDGEQKLDGIIEKCTFRYSGEPGACPSLMYSIRLSPDKIETLPLEKVDKCLKDAGAEVEPIRCLQAVAESPGYGFGVDHGLPEDLVPVLLNPRMSEAAAQAAISSSVFRDTIVSSATLLLVDPKDMEASEWLRLLGLLVMKCAASEMLQNIIGKLENDANESMAPELEKLAKVTDMAEILPDISSYDELEENVDDQASKEPLSDADAGESEMKKTTGETMTSQPGDDAMVVDAGNIEVVEEMVTDETPPPAGAPAVASSSTPEAPAPPTSAAVAGEPVRDLRAEAAMAKAKRQKSIEDSFAAYTIKNQLKPAIASFEVDNVSSVVDASLSSGTPGLAFTSLRCRRMLCHFCGLTDTALGYPLLRVPDSSEWAELLPHAARGRKTHLIAELPTSDAGKEGTKIVGLKIRVDGELVSEKEDLFQDDDVGMADFPPRSDEGFQADLLFRYETGLPFVTGSLSAHECCAVAAHKSRKEQMMQDYRERQAILIEQEAGITCGRCLEIGRDGKGRSYWKLIGDPKSLFVSDPGQEGTKWYRFSGSEGVASVLVALRRDPIAKDLNDYFPEARKMVKQGTWQNLLLRRKYPRLAEFLDREEGLDDEAAADQGSITVEGGYDPFDEGEEALVESPSGYSLWDAVIVTVSRKPDPENKGSLVIDAYEVHYTGWSTRFVEWVPPSRVVEANEHNRSLQSELQEEMSASRCGLPPSLNFMRAKDFLLARDRARGGLALSDFGAIASKGLPDSEERQLALMKAALLAIEAAVPIGGIHNTNTGTWRPDYAKQWRRMVKEAGGPAALTKLAIYLEDMVSDAWKKEFTGHLLSCLPHRWKAMGEANISGLAIRIAVLDRTIKYETTDRKRYSKKKRR